MSKILGSKLKLILVILGAIVILTTAAILLYLRGIGAVDSKDDKTVSVNIPQGSGAAAIVDILDEEGLVKSKTCAKIHVRIGRYDTLQANTYMFNKSMNLPQMLKAINSGDFNYVSKQQYTIIEGATLPQAAEAMSKELPFTAAEIMAVWTDKAYLKELIDKYWFLTDEILQEGIMYPLEGYIYPETYFVTDENPDIKSITAKMLDETDKVLTDKKKSIEKMDMSVHQFLSLSSVVENESLFKKDRAKIAGVFVNRLNKDMPLQSDITVLYALQEKRVAVTNADLQVDSKYNTYKNTGLPVGPVCSPSSETMDDVLNYEKSDYYFFFAKEDGSVIYSKTYDEHQKAVNENKWY
ncbi:MAG: endolytic transglycosylase MltG [Anaerovoracaceae bacterium]